MEITLLLMENHGKIMELGFCITVGTLLSYQSVQDIPSTFLQDDCVAFMPVCRDVPVRDDGFMSLIRLHTLAIQ